MVFVNLAERYGANMTFAELAAALGGQEGNPAVRAVLQILRYQLGASRAHERVPGATAEERTFGSGAAFVAEETIEWVDLLVKRDVERPALRELKEQYSPGEGG